MTAAYDLYVITDEGPSKGLTHAEIARRAVAGGANVIQLRDKRMSGEELMGCALEIRAITKKAGVLFIVNDRLDIAIASKADGVHLGQDDLPARLARPLALPASSSEYLRARSKRRSRRSATAPTTSGSGPSAIRTRRKMPAQYAVLALYPW